jgi:hypothetical protein
MLVKRLSFIFLVSAFFSAALLSAADFTAASCNTSDVQAAINSASNGDTVQIPNGSCSWSTGIATTKQIWIRAQNYTPTTGGTSSRNVTITNNSSSALFDLTTGNSFHVRVTGIAFDEGSGNVNHIYLHGSGTMVALIDDDYFQIKNRFGNEPGVAAIAWEALGGVMWNVLAEGVGGGLGGQCCPEGASIHVSSPLAWASNSTLGSLDTNGTQNLYIEDSTWRNFGQAPDIDDNGRVVIRHSTLDGISALTHGFTSAFGGRQFEYYNDTIITTTSNRNVAGRYFWARAGTGVLHDNTVAYQNQGYGAPTLFQSIVECPQNGSGGGFTCNVGQVPSDSALIGSGPEVERQVGTGWDSGSGYHIDPVYLWNNCQSGATLPCAGDSTWGTQSPGFVTLNRDIFVDSGAKPSYTPYTYPHPSRSGGSQPSGSPPSGPPAPPTNLAATVS